MLNFRKKGKDNEKKEREQEQLVDFLNEFGDGTIDLSKEDADVTLEGIDIIQSDVVLDGVKEKSNSGFVFIVVIVLGITMLAGVFAGYFMTAYQFIFGIQPIEGSLYSNNQLTVISKDYTIPFNEISKGTKVYFMSDGKYSIGSIESIKPDSVKMLTDKGLKTLNKEKVKFIIKE